MNADPLLAMRPTLNPYLAALGLFGRRLAWDVRLESFRSRTRLRAMRGRHAGRKAIILCNGPSLSGTDFELIRDSDVFVFGLNKINLLFERTPMRPHAIVAVNPFVIEQNAAFFNATSIPLYLDSGACGLIRRAPNVTFIHTTAVNKFARDCSISVNQGYTVTFVALQLAYHLGFRAVGMVGCDHGFTSKGPPNLAVTAGPRDDDHFAPNYFPPGARWQLPDLPQSEASYHLARRVFDASGGRVVNCTEGGNLEVFERESLSDFLSP